MSWLGGGGGTGRAASNVNYHNLRASGFGNLQVFGGGGTGRSDGTGRGALF